MGNGFTWLHFPASLSYSNGSDPVLTAPGDRSRCRTGIVGPCAEGVWLVHGKHYSAPGSLLGAGWPSLWRVLLFSSLSVSSPSPGTC